MKKKVLIGMSGGLDSTAAVLLLKNRGFEVVGLTLQLFDESEGVKTGFIQDAQKLAATLEMEHHVVDYREAFQKQIIDWFAKEYIAGRTPNPCALCNRIVKWEVLNEYSKKLGCDYIATGHYVQSLWQGEKFYITRGIDKAKDQSYFLWNLSQEIIQKMITPLGDYTKQEVRQFLKAYGWKSMAEKKESMGICFLGSNNYRDFLDDYIQKHAIEVKPGKVYTESGEEIGRHKGLAYYTVGQKRDLELNREGKYYVKQMDTSENSMVVAKWNDLNRSDFYIHQVNLVDEADLQFEKNLRVMIRGFGLNPTQEALITRENDLLRVQLSDPAWAIAPGQPVAIYAGEKLLGGGIVYA